MIWHKVPDIQPTNDPFIAKAKINGKGICIVGYEGEVFAVSSTCPHAGADLSGGWCKDGKLICPFHRYSYDIHTGRGATGQNDYIDTYPVEVRDDGIYVGFTTFMERLKKAFS